MALKTMSITLVLLYTISYLASLGQASVMFSLRTAEPDGGAASNQQGGRVSLDSTMDNIDSAVSALGSLLDPTNVGSAIGGSLANVFGALGGREGPPERPPALESQQGAISNGGVSGSFGNGAFSGSLSGGLTGPGGPHLNGQASFNANALMPSFDGNGASSLLEYTLNPVGSGLKYFMPNTYQGISSDLGNGYTMMSNGAASGLNSLKNNFNTFNDNALNRYQLMQQQMTNRYLSNEELMRRLYEIVSNPQQMCKNLAQQSQMLMQNGQQQGNAALQQAGQTSSSLLNKLGGLSPFGK